MSDRRPIAFLSYVRSDDDHDNGRITAFRKRLEGEVRMQTGEPFAIFQDRNDIRWGQLWEERINKSLSDVTFLIPIITPSFFRSPACRTEFNTFSRKEKLLGLNRLILPLYYVACEQFTDSYNIGIDEIADVLRTRNWTDWRQFRFKQLSEESVAAALAEMAATIRASIIELNSIGDLPAARPLSPQKAKSAPGLPAILAEEDILSPAKPKAVETPTDGLQYEGIPDFSSRQLADTYHAFTKKFDEVVEASELAEQAEILKLHKYVETFSRALRKIHNSSLSSFLSRFKPREGAPPLSVSVLIDNSGSMRGARITHTAAWCNIMAEWMDRLRISTEFLGYTTRAWKGGRSKETWIAAGKPANPGRMNDLRHLVYKSFSASLGAAAPNFGVMAIEGVLKENVDGEAVLWAISRLQQQTPSSKILFVISDGAPVDDTTLSHNPGDYLEKHLLKVIDSIPANITLYAIGLGHDVSKYYPNAVTVNEASELGPRFFETLINDEAFQRSFVSSVPKKRYRYYTSDEQALEAE